MNQISSARPDLQFAERLVGPPWRRCHTGMSCPDIFELTDGNFAIIGTDATDELTERLPDDAGVAPHERIVVIPRELLVQARRAIPNE